jgi:large subunit ribosomal protein L18
MEILKNKKSAKRQRRHKKIRAKIKGTEKRPRLTVFRSNRFLYVQLINDETGRTIAAGSTVNTKAKRPLERAAELGEKIAEAAKGKKISKVVFDRGGYIYTGKIKALADGARKGGLKF